MSGITTCVILFRVFLERGSSFVPNPPHIFRSKYKWLWEISQCRWFFWKSHSMEYYCKEFETFKFEKIAFEEKYHAALWDIQVFSF